jgi:hypothetical protein
MLSGLFLVDGLGRHATLNRSRIVFLPEPCLQISTVPTHATLGNEV